MRKKISGLNQEVQFFRCNILLLLLIFSVGCNSRTNDIPKTPPPNAPQLVNQYSAEGYFCHSIVDQEDKNSLSERANIKLQLNSYQVFHCSKKEFSTLVSAIRRSVIIVADRKNSVIKVGYYSDEIFL